MPSECVNVICNGRWQCLKNLRVRDGFAITQFWEWWLARGSVGDGGGVARQVVT